MYWTRSCASLCSRVTQRRSRGCSDGCSRSCSSVSLPKRCRRAGGPPGAMSSAKGSRCQCCLPSSSVPPSLLQQLSPGRAPGEVLCRGERRQGADREQLWECLSTARLQRGPLRVGQGNGVGGRGWRKAVPAASSPSCPCGWELCSPGSGRRAAAPCHSSGAD